MTADRGWKPLLRGTVTVYRGWKPLLRGSGMEDRGWKPLLRWVEGRVVLAELSKKRNAWLIMSRRRRHA